MEVERKTSSSNVDGKSFPFVLGWKQEKKKNEEVKMELPPK